MTTADGNHMVITTLTSNKSGILQEVVVWRNTNITPCPKTPDIRCCFNYGTCWNTIQNSRLWHLTNYAFTTATKQPPKGRAWQPRQQETCYRQYCRNCACINKISLLEMVMHLHLVCWYICKNEGLPHRCAAASPPATGPAHLVGLQKKQVRSKYAVTGSFTELDIPA